MNYQSFQNQVSSEKLTLAVLHASKRLMAWTLHSGSVYKLTGFDISSIVALEDSGTAYTEVFSVADVTASRFYNDRENQTLYLRTTGSDNPNGRFLVLTFKLFFSNAPVTLPDDLSTGPEVYWEPMVKSTSAFGVEIDTINQTSEAIEGAGTLTLFNDTEFWPSRFGKLTFENKKCQIYSYNRELSADSAKLIFDGFVDKKAYSDSSIQFSLTDQLGQLRSPVLLSDISELGERSSPDVASAKQRMILGRVYGHRPTNLDEVLEGYPLSGTVSINVGSNTVTGSGTSFLAKLSPNDKLVLGDREYTIGTVTSDTSLTLTENLGGTVNLSAVPLSVKPDRPKRYMNRKWLVAGHALRQPTTEIQAGSTISRLIVASTKDIHDGEWVYVGSLGSGELVRVGQVISSTLLTLSQSLVTNPAPGTVLFKPAIQNVRIDDVLLTYYQDYTFDPVTSILTLSALAEKNSAPLKQMPNNVTFTSGSRVATGTAFSSILSAGSVVGCVGQADMFEVLSVDSDTQVTFRTASTFSATAKGTYKTFILNPSDSVLTCEALGRTKNGTPSGDLITSAPEAVRQLLTDIGLGSALDNASFDAAEEIAYQPIGIVIPTEYGDQDAPTYRDVLNRINQSVFGSLVQSNNFLLSYLVLRTKKSTQALRLDESDILSFSVDSIASKLIKTAIVRYRPMEYDYSVGKESIRTQQKTSDAASYLVKTERTRTFETVLVDELDAIRQANRWSMILENAATAIKIRTKLQAATLEVGDIVDIAHRKLYERYGSSVKRKLALVESVKKTGSEVELVLVDLSNTFNRIGAITDIETNWSDTGDEGRLYGGFISDQFGLIDNDENSFGVNLIW